MGSTVLNNGPSAEAPSCIGADAAGIVPPVIRRHAEDAAFYWKQIDGIAEEPGINAGRAAHFGVLLATHLEGLGLAGAEGARVALAALERWNKPGEAFVAMWASLVANDDTTRQRVMQRVCRQPDLLLRGVVSALTWAANTPRARDWLLDLPAAADPAYQVAALRASILLGWPAPNWHAAATHAHPAVRAAACRAAAHADQAFVQPLLHDADLLVRAEAAIVLGRWAVLQSDHEACAQVASALWQCIGAQTGVATAASGWNGIQARRRLARWLRHLAWLAPIGQVDLTPLLSQLPLRSALDFLLYHGDAHQLPFVVQALHDAEQGRWAGWVWQSLTGVQLAENGLVMPNPPVDPAKPLTQSQRDADRGLPLPDAQTIAHHPATGWRADLIDGRPPRVLMGQVVTPQSLHALLDPETNAMQALRAVAAHGLSYVQPGAQLPLRASPYQQAHQWRLLQAL
jgi:hypothetical protein